MGNTKSTTRYESIAPYPINVSLTIPSENKLGINLSMDYEDTIYIAYLPAFITNLIFKNSHDFDITVNYSDDSFSVYHFSPLAYINTLEYYIDKYVDINVIIVNQKRFKNKDKFELSMMYDLFGKPMKLFICPLLRS
jgi:hypothetical protein